MGEDGHFHHPSKAFHQFETQVEEFSPDDLTMERRNGVITGGVCPPKKTGFFGSVFGSIASIFHFNRKKASPETLVSANQGGNEAFRATANPDKKGTLGSTFSTLKQKLFTSRHKGQRRVRKTRRNKKKPREESINMNDIVDAKAVRDNKPPIPTQVESNSDAINIPNNLMRGTENVESYAYHESMMDFVGGGGSFADIRDSTASFMTSANSPSSRGISPMNSPSLKARKRPGEAKKNLKNLLKSPPTTPKTVQMSPISAAVSSKNSQVSKPAAIARPLTTLTSTSQESAEKRYSLDGKTDLNRETKSFRDQDADVKPPPAPVRSPVRQIPQVPPSVPERTPRDRPPAPPRPLQVQKQTTLDGSDLIGLPTFKDRPKVDSAVTFSILQPTFGDAEEDKKSDITDFDPDLGESDKSNGKKEGFLTKLYRTGKESQAAKQAPKEVVPPTPSLDQFIIPQQSDRKISKVEEEEDDDEVLLSPTAKSRRPISIKSFTGILMSRKHKQKKDKKKGKRQEADSAKQGFEEMDVPPSPYLPNSPASFADSPVSASKQKKSELRKVSDIDDLQVLASSKKSESSRKAGFFNILTSKRKKKEKQVLVPIGEPLNKRSAEKEPTSINTDML